MKDSFTDMSFERFQKLILQRTGIIFGERRRNELKRHVLTTTKKQDASNIDHLYRRLSESPTDSPIWDFFIDTIIVGETYFFREELLFQALRHKILPEIIARHEKDRSMRIWSAGCSTGEEPYSLAILMDQLLGADIKNWHIFILATDINKPSLKKAIDGHYRSWSLRQTSKTIISTYFKEKKDRFHIREDIQKRVMFSYLNLNNPVYPSLATCTHAMDLILWRNVAIYFTDDVIQDVLKRFYRCLLPSGYFNIGASEAAHMSATPFIAKQFSGTFIYQKDQPAMPSLTQTIKPIQPKYPPDTKNNFSADQNVNVNPSIVSTTKVKTESSLSFLEQAEQHAQNQRYTEAVQAYKSHLSIYSNDAKAWFQMARVYANNGDLKHAKEACTHAIKYDPLIVEAYYIQGLINEEDGKLEEAIADYKKTLYLKPDFVLAHYHLSCVYQQTQEDAMADRHRTQSIRILSQRPSDENIPGADELTVGQLLALLTGN
ncbi:MAG: tetratricopeptide repeat protein [Candidatus Magnetomorum sp.]|nr:tetratricopeptide repeat protein [Candidatus Magnetomorum sp.]